MSFDKLVATPEVLYTKELEKRHISKKEVAALKLELLSPDETFELLGHTRAWSIKLPYFDFKGKTTSFSRVKLLPALTGMKYSQRRTSGSHVYFPPGVDWDAVSKDINSPLIITEGEFKSWAIDKAIRAEGLVDHACVGLAGVTSWRDKSGLPLHAELMHFILKRKRDFTYASRKVYILFDYDGKMPDGEPNPQVGLAESKLAITLQGLGAEVHICRVGRFAPGAGAKYAIDDHLDAGGTLGEVLNATAAVINGTPTLDTELHAFSTQYALLNGDVIRIDDGFVFSSYQKAKLHAAERTFTITGAKPNGTPVTRVVSLMEEYPRWRKKINLKAIGMYPQYQGMLLTPDGCYNTMPDWAFDPVEGSVDEYLDFCAYFFKDDPAFEDYWHDWVANIIQRPWERNYTTPQFISSAEGVGKSALAEFVAFMLGMQTEGPALVLGPDELFSPFTGKLKGKVFIVVNEPSSDRETHSAKLKNLITAPSISINHKYGAEYSVDNYLNFVFTSNRPFVTTMGDASRREAIYSPDSLDPTKVNVKVTSLMHWAKTAQGFGKVLNWYASRDITKFNPRVPAPMSHSKMQAIALSQSDTQRLASEIAQWVKAELKGVCVMTKQHRITLQEIFEPGVRPVSAQFLNRALASHGKITPNIVISSSKQHVRGALFEARGCKSDISNLSELLRTTDDAIEKLIAVDAHNF